MKTYIGRVTHYYNRIGVAVLDLQGELKVGEKILILGHTTDFFQTVASMEINHQKVLSVGPGSDVALKVNAPVRKDDQIFKVVEEEIDPETQVYDTGYGLHPPVVHLS
jgi:hypothetical protein